MKIHQHMTKREIQKYFGVDTHEQGNCCIIKIVLLLPRSFKMFWCFLSVRRAGFSTHRKLKVFRKRGKNLNDFGVHRLK